MFTAGKTIVAHLNSNGFLPDFHEEIQYNPQNYVTAVLPTPGTTKYLCHGALTGAQRCSSDLANGRQCSK